MWLHTLKAASTPPPGGRSQLVSYDGGRRLKAPGTIAIGGVNGDKAWSTLTRDMIQP